MVSVRTTRPRVVIAGLGDSGVLTAMALSRRTDVTGISVKPRLVSGQELGLRLSRPDYWSRNYYVSFDAFRRLDRVDRIRGEIVGVDLTNRLVDVIETDGAPRPVLYDVLVISTGVTNGFWRRPTLQTEAEVEAAIAADHDRVRAAASIAVIGGGASAVSTATNLAAMWPEKRIDLYFPGDRALRHHHERVWDSVRKRLVRLGAGIHPGYRAVIPDGFAFDTITDTPVTWSTGQDPTVADAVIWATGRVTPNTSWLPEEVLDDHGFVRVDGELRVPGQAGVFAIGDVAATDPLRTSARNFAHRLLARNVLAYLDERPLRRYEPPQQRWGSVIGVQRDGVQIFSPNGRPFRFPSWTIDTVLNPAIVRWGIYGGVRRPKSPAESSLDR